MPRGARSSPLRRGARWRAGRLAFPRSRRSALSVLAAVFLATILAVAIPTPGPRSTAAPLRAASETPAAAPNVSLPRALPTKGNGPSPGGGIPAATEVEALSDANPDRPFYGGYGGGNLYEGNERDADGGNGFLSVINTATGAVSLLDLNTVGYGFAYDPVWNYAYVSLFTSKNTPNYASYPRCVAVLHGAKEVACLSIPRLNFTTSIVYDAATGTVWVGTGAGITIISGTDVVGFLSVSGIYGQGIYDPLDGLIYFIGGSFGSALLAFNALSGASAGQIGLGGDEVYRLALDTVDGTLYAAEAYGVGVAAIDVSTGKVVNVAATFGAEDVAFDPHDGLVYASDQDAGRTGPPIFVVRPSDNASVGYSYWSSPDKYVRPAPDPIGLTYAPSTGQLYLANAASSSVDAFAVGTAYNVTFSESGLAEYRPWGVWVGNLSARGVAPGPIVVPELNGSYNFSVDPPPGYHAIPRLGTFEVDGAPQTIRVQFLGVPYLSVVEEYVGDFLQNVSFPDVIGVYTDYGSFNATAITISIGSTGYTPELSGPAGWGGPYNLSVDLGSLPAGAVATVTAYFNESALPERVSLNRTLPLHIAAEPPWLATLLSFAGGVTFTNHSANEWNNTVTVASTPILPMAEFFGISVLSQLLSGPIDVVPDVSIDFELNATGAVSLGVDFDYQPPPIEVGGAEVTVEVNVSLTGSLSLNFTTGKISWEKSELTLTVLGGAEWDEDTPFGLDFNFGDGVDLHLGLTIDFSLNASFTASFLLEPTTSPEQEAFAGLLMKMMAETAAIDVSFTVEAEFVIPDLFEIDAGGTLDFSMHLNANPPYDAGGTLTGTLFGGAKFLPLDLQVGVSFSVSYSWGAQDPAATSFASLLSRIFSADSPHEFTGAKPIPRYYNTSGYDRPTWEPGNWSGKFLNDIYPFTHLAAAASGPDAYLVYGLDNVSRPEARAASLEGWTFDASTRTAGRLTVPVPSGEAVSDPDLFTLPNGSILALWSAIPFSSESLTEPGSQTTVILQGATYAPTTGRWSPVGNWTTSGVARSYATADAGSSARLLVMEAPSILSTDSTLLEYDATSRALLGSWNVSSYAATEISAFLPALSVVLLGGGPSAPPIALNLSSDATEALPAEPGYNLTAAEPSPGLPSDVSLLYSSGVNDLAVLYDLASAATAESLSLPTACRSAQFFGYGGSEYLVAGEPHDVVVELLAPGGVSTFRTIAAPDLYSVQGLLVGTDLLVEYFTNSGNASDPHLNLSLALLPMTVAPRPTLALSVVSAREVRLTWSETDPQEYAASGYTVLVGNATSPLVAVGRYPANATSVSLKLAAPGDYRFEVEADNPLGSSLPSRSVAVWEATFQEHGLPTGTTFSVSLNGSGYSTASGEATFEEPNGSYPFAVVPTPGYRASPTSGTVTIAGKDVVESIGFARVVRATYDVTFEESGLPPKALAKTGWTVVLNGTLQHAVSPSILFTGVPNGTLPVLVTGPPGYVSHASGTVTVSGATTVPVPFAKGRTVSLTFREKGLESVQSWCVEVDGAPACTARTTQTYVDLSPGTYAYSVLSPTVGQHITVSVGKTTLGTSGSLTLRHSETLSLTFVYPYAVTFTETGLTSGTWSVSIGGLRLSNASGEPIRFFLGNGTYRYKVGAETGLKAVGSPKTVVVKGAPTSVLVTFSQRRSRSVPGPLGADPPWAAVADPGVRGLRGRPG